MKNGITKIKPGITQLELLLTVELYHSRNIEPYKTNKAFFQSSLNIISNFLATDFKVLRTDVSNALKKDTRNCLSYFDELKNKFILSINIDNDECYKTTAALTKEINDIFNSFIAACRECFSTAPSKIFNPITNDVNIANTCVPNYGAEASLCIIFRSSTCYTNGIAGSVQKEPVT